MQGETHYFKSNFSSLIDFNGTQIHEAAIDFSTLSIPVSAKYLFPKDNFSLYIQGGPHLELKLGSNSIVNSQRVSGGMVSNSSREAFPIKENIQVGPWAGLGVKRKFNGFDAEISLRYFRMPRLNEKVELIFIADRTGRVQTIVPPQVVKVNHDRVVIVLNLIRK